MTEQARFCVKCGAGLTEGTRFCTACGAAVTTVAAPGSSTTPDPVAAPEPLAAPASTPDPQPTPPAASGERVLGLIPNAVLNSGFLGVGSKPYVLVLTDRRVIFAFVTKEMTKKMVTDAREGAKAEGKGFFGQWGAQLGAFAAFSQRYYEMTPDQTLAETAESFAIDRSTIVKAKIVHGTMDENGAESPDRLIIKTTGKKYRLTLRGGTGQAREALIAAAMI